MAAVRLTDEENRTNVRKKSFPPSQSACADSSPEGRAYVKVSDKIPLFALRKATSILHFAFCILHIIGYRRDISVSVLYFVILEGAKRPKDLIPQRTPESSRNFCYFAESPNKPVGAAPRLQSKQLAAQRWVTCIFTLYVIAITLM